MMYEIPNEVINASYDCPHNISCSTTGKCGDKELCAIQCDVTNDILFLETGECSDCPYRCTLGNLQICRCPTRNAIFRDYQN